MIPNAAKHRSAVKAPLFTGDADANLSSHVPFVDFGETTTQGRLSLLQTGTAGSSPKSLFTRRLISSYSLLSFSSSNWEQIEAKEGALSRRLLPHRDYSHTTGPGWLPFFQPSALNHAKNEGGGKGAFWFIYKPIQRVGW